MSTNPCCLVGLDLGLSLTDVVTYKDFMNDKLVGEPSRNSYPSIPQPSPAAINTLLETQSIDFSSIQKIAVTGGRAMDLPDTIAGKHIVKINEIDAIGTIVYNTHQREENPQWPVVAVSTGTGTACVLVQEDGSYSHLGGTAIGGGTLMGLAALTLGETDPQQITALAQRGTKGGVNLTLGEAVSGPIGSLPKTATASNFGKVSRALRQDSKHTFKKEDIAAGIVQMVAEAIGRVTTDAYLRTQAKRVYLLGRTITIDQLAKETLEILSWANTEFKIIASPGSGTATGALMAALKR